MNELQTMCRTCLSTNGPFLLLFNKNLNKNISSMREMLEAISSIKASENDGLPKNVCLNCVSEINRSYSFKLKCETSEQTLRQLLDLDVECDEDGIEILQTVEFNKESIIPTEEDIEDPNLKFANYTSDVVEGKIKCSSSSSDLKNLKNGNQSQNKQDEKFSMSDNEEDPLCYEPIEEESLKDNHDFIISEASQTGAFTSTDNKTHYEVYQIDLVEKPDTANNNLNQDSNTIISSIVDGKNIFKCTKCPSEFVHFKNLKKHLERHEKTRKMKNSKSQVKSVEKEKDPLWKENEKIIIYPDPKNKGNSTEITFETVAELIQESSIVKPPETDLNTKYSCNNCKACFSSTNSLKYHIKSDLCSRKHFECLICKKVFVNEENLLEHMKEHPTAKYQCTKCSKKFSNNEDLKMHSVQKHSLKLKNQCEVCLKIFTMHSTLKDHMRTHTGEKPFKCEICEKSFTQNTNLKQHLMRHSNTKPFKCKMCPCEFVSKGELNSHSRIHTGEHPFVCEVCAVSFTTSSSLQKHRRIHTGERPYPCDLCPQRFACLNTMKNHRRTHTGEKPFKCSKCDKAFKQKSDMLGHQKYYCYTLCELCGTNFPNGKSLKAHLNKCSGSKSDPEPKTRRQKCKQAEQSSSPENLETIDAIFEESILDEEGM